MVCSIPAVLNALGGPNFNGHVQRLITNISSEAQGKNSPLTASAQKKHAANSIFEQFGPQALLILDALMLAALAHAGTAVAGFSSEEYDRFSAWISHYGQRHGLPERLLTTQERLEELRRAALAQLPTLDARSPQAFWGALADPATRKILGVHNTPLYVIVNDVTLALRLGLRLTTPAEYLAMYEKAAPKLG